MYKYMVDYLGGDHNVEYSNTKVAALKKIHDKFRVKPYLIARLKTNMTARSAGYHDYREIKRYEMKVVRGRMGLREI
jgi:hypothetical protein